MNSKAKQIKAKRHDDKMKRLGFYRRWVHESVMRDVRKVYEKVISADKDNDDK